MRNLLRVSPRHHGGRHFRRRQSFSRPLQVQELEDRHLLALVVSFHDGALFVDSGTSTTGQAIALTASTNGALFINGLQPDVRDLLTGSSLQVPFSVAQIAAIRISTGAGNDAIDLRGVTASAFIGLGSIPMSVDAGDGAKSVFGSDFSDVIVTGVDNDDIHGARFQPP